MNKSKKNKPRLYVALYTRRKDSAFHSAIYCDSYHWALVIGPPTGSRTDPGTRYDVHKRTTGDTSRWVYEETHVQDPPAKLVLVRVAIVKILDVAKVETIFRSTPLRDDDPTWRCLHWVRDAVKALLRDGTSVRGYIHEGDWEDIEATTRRFVRRKRDQGRLRDSRESGLPIKIPTWNFWERREVLVALR